MTDNPTVQRRPGGRTARNRENILRAATQILLDEGYENLSVNRVAAAAGVAETTIYRRWPTQAHLAAAAIADLAGAQNPIPDTGTLEDDLRALLTQIVGLLEQPGVRRVIRTVISLDESDPTITDLKAEFWATRFAGSAAIVTRAIARGELPADTDPHEVIEELCSPVYFRTLVTGRPLDDAVVDSSVGMVLRRRDAGPSKA